MELRGIIHFATPLMRIQLRPELQRLSRNSNTYEDGPLD